MESERRTARGLCAVRVEVPVRRGVPGLKHLVVPVTELIASHVCLTDAVGLAHAARQLEPLIATVVHERAGAANDARLPVDRVFQILLADRARCRAWDNRARRVVVEEVLPVLRLLILARDLDAEVAEHFRITTLDVAVVAIAAGDLARQALERARVLRAQRE